MNELGQGVDVQLNTSTKNGVGSLDEKTSFFGGKNQILGYYVLSLHEIIVGTFGHILDKIDHQRSDLNLRQTNKRLAYSERKTNVHFLVQFS